MAKGPQMDERTKFLLAVVGSCDPSIQWGISIPRQSVDAPLFRHKPTLWTTQWHISDYRAALRRLQLLTDILVAEYGAASSPYLVVGLAHWWLFNW